MLRIVYQFGMFLDGLVLLFRWRILRLPTQRIVSSWPAMLFYFDVDFTGLLDRFLFYECDHPLEFVGDLFITEAVRIGHNVDEQSVVCFGCG